MGTLISLAVLAATTIFLKKFWYDPLNSEERAMSTVDAALIQQPHTAD